MISVELMKTVNNEVKSQRYSACQNCQHFISQSSTIEKIRNAETGIEEEIKIEKVATCQLLQIAIEGFIIHTNSQCPMEFWP